MTDRHIVNTCLKTSLEKIKLECIPNSSDNSEEIRKKISKLNGFKCNLHILVNLASQAESGLKLWEQSVLESESFHQFTYNQNTSDFIRASTKLCVPGADEKSGITERNSLITSVYYYVDNPVYLAGCRAFGIVDKILTERQLFDNLPGGSLNEETEGVNGKELRDESMTVKPTNIVSERDFANLDRLKKKPNANIIALEGLILFTNNKTLHWRSNGDRKENTNFKIARKGHLQC
ncbi:unnamed protein product [Mytilus coruscus]|uniref:Uncharacterized protein n=1 Tax=Mytilus coruscus TaxID=42192 RepID=A0A6J8EX04_MYTCO|nr:unnamed protein product [Mytilus coruscus]